MILDLKLSGALDGFEIARRLRELPSPPRIVAVTGRPREGTPEEAVFDAYLMKPCPPGRLVDTVLTELA